MLLAARWEQAEAALFPQVLAQPELYQRAVLLVAAVVERLRALGPSIEALVTASDTAPDLVAATGTDQQLPVAGLDPVVIGLAACSLRYREVLAEQALQQRRDRLSDARATGQSWAVLEERGDPHGDPFRPYFRLEAHVATGRALVVTAARTEDFVSVIHLVRAARVDLDTCDLLDVDDGAEVESSDFEAREGEVARLRKAAEKDW
jgi:hypothetical protein